MTKKSLSLTMSVLLLLGLFSACSSDESSIDNSDMGLGYFEGTLDPIMETGAIDEEIADFFDSELPDLGRRSDGFFVDLGKDVCYIINNRSELQRIYAGSRAIPNIDFDTYTLILGQKIMPGSYYTLLRQELTCNDNGLCLNLYVPELEGTYAALQYLYFWSLYPKLKERNITINVIEEKI